MKDFEQWKKRRERKEKTGGIERSTLEHNTCIYLIAGVVNYSKPKTPVPQGSNIIDIPPPLLPLLPHYSIHLPSLRSSLSSQTPASNPLLLPAFNPSHPPRLLAPRFQNPKLQPQPSQISSLVSSSSTRLDFFNASPTNQHITSAKNVDIKRNVDHLLLLLSNKNSNLLAHRKGRPP